MSVEKTELIHATFVKVGKVGVLILGKSGAGKSALALTLIDGGGRGIGEVDLATTLIADDQVCLWRDKVTAQVYGKSPEAIAGMLEIRGLGIIKFDYLQRCPVGLVVQIKPVEEIERMPDFPQSCTRMLGQDIPIVEIPGNDVTAPSRIRAAVGVLLASNAVENDTAIG